MKGVFEKEVLSKPYLVIALLFLACLLPYSNTFGNEFLWDDKTLIVYNENLHTPSKNINFIRDFWAVNEVDRGSPYFRPLISTLYIIDYNLWGFSPAGYHLTNIFLLFGVVAGVYLFVSHAFQNKLLGFLSAVLFALHPIHTENVTWIAGRTDVAMGIFYFFSLYFFARYRSTKKNPNLYVSIVLVFFALLSKESAVTLPVAIVLYDWCFHKKKITSLLKAWKSYVGHFVMIPLFSLLRAWAFYFESRFISLDNVFISSQETGVFSAIVKVMYSIANYLFLTFFPFRLKIRWELPIVQTPLRWLFLFSCVILCIYGWYTWYSYKNDRKGFFLAAFFLLNVLLASNIITIRDSFAERFVFLASLSVCVAIPYLLLKHLKNKEQALALIVIVFLIFGIRTYVRNNDWESMDTLLRKEIVVNPLSAETHFLLGSHYEGTLNNTAKAIPHYITALQIDDTRTDAHLALGRHAMENGEFAVALEHFQKCKLYGPPEFAWKGANMLGFMLTELGKRNLAENNTDIAQKNFDGAVENYLYVVQQKPMQGHFHCVLAEAALLSGNVDLANEALINGNHFDSANPLCAMVRDAIESDSRAISSQSTFE